MFACNNYPFRAFVTMIYLMSTEVLLNLVAPLDSVVPSFDFEQINVFFLLLVLIPLVLHLIRSVSAEVPLNLFLAFDLGVPSSDVDRINIWFMALIPLALHSFPL